MIGIAGALRPTLCALALLTLLLAGGCGWVEVPGSGGGPTTADKPPPNSVLVSARVMPKPAPTQSEGTTSPAFPTSPSRNVVQVVAGDTVYSFSRRYGVPVRAIIEANKLQPPYHLNVGQWVTLPRENEHTVRDGETMDSIAQIYGVDAYALASVNGLSAPYDLREGQALRIPKETVRQGQAPEEETPAPIVSKAPTPSPSIPEPPATSASGFIWPVKGEIISGFGRKTKGLHNDGINIAVEHGTPVRAAEGGVVAYAGNELRGFGNMILIKHSGGWVTAYAHNEILLVGRGDRVQKGQIIARSGTSGSVTQPQLHFELRKGKKAVDPLKYLGKGAV